MRKIPAEKDQVKREKMKTAEQEIVQNQTKGIETRQDPVKEVELSSKTITSFGQEKDINKIKKEKTFIALNYYKEHYGIRTSSSQNTANKVKK